MRQPDALADPARNRGVGFTPEQREQLGIDGWLPSGVFSLEEQDRILHERVLQQSTPLHKRILLMDALRSGHALFGYALSHHLEEYLPIVYAPTVAEAIRRYTDYAWGSNVAYVSAWAPERIRDILERHTRGRQVDIVIVTDGEGILGIGDWGVNGAEILTGKAAVYTAAARIDPERILGVMLDAGTDRVELREHPAYVGMRAARVRGTHYDAAIAAIVAAVRELLPGALLHWEDFGRANAARVLERYQDEVLSINDDIQGTGVTVLAAVHAAARAAGTQFRDTRLLVVGAGSAGVGIADRVAADLAEAGCPSDDIPRHIALVDRTGLVLRGAADLTPGQQRWARDSADFPGLRDVCSLTEVVEQFRPTVLVGTSGTPGTFTREVVEAMVRGCDRPLICPISNPVDLAEARAEDVITWSRGRALVATGSPSAPVTFAGVRHVIGQGNNALMYPGIVLGALAARSRRITGGMLSAAAHAIAGMGDPSIPGNPVLPPMSELPAVTERVALAVASQAVADGVAQISGDVEDAVRAQYWTPGGALRR